MVQFTGTSVFHRLCCIGPIDVSDHDAVKQDIANFKAAMAAAKPVDAFMPAASPGVVVGVPAATAHYPNARRLYRGASPTRCGEEYEAIANAGFVLQLDCPDLAMARHTGFQDLTEAEFLKQAEHADRGAEPRAGERAGEFGAAASLLGQLRGPARFRHSAAEDPADHPEGEAAGDLVRGGEPAACARMDGWRDAKLPDDKVLIPGVIDTCTNYVEHPELVAQRICQLADIVGRERVIAGTDCGFGTFVGTCRPRRSGDRIPQTWFARRGREAGIRAALALSSSRHRFVPGRSIVR